MRQSSHGTSKPTCSINSDMMNPDPARSRAAEIAFFGVMTRVIIVQFPNQLKSPLVTLVCGEEQTIDVVQPGSHPSHTESLQIVRAQAASTAPTKTLQQLLPPLAASGNRVEPQKIAPYCVDEFRKLQTCRRIWDF